MSDTSKTGGTSRVAIGCLILVVLGLGGCGVLAIVGSNSDAGRENDAQVLCEQMVKDRLKSPASADFSGVTATEGTGDTYTVAGAVDSQNSFGAKVRNSFSCTVRKQASGDGFDLVSLTGLDS